MYFVVVDAPFCICCQQPLLLVTSYHADTKRYKNANTFGFEDVFVEMASSIF